MQGALQKIGEVKFRGVPCPLVLDQTGAIFVVYDAGSKLNGPTLITFAGYLASLAWLAGAPWWIGVCGVLADEIDGRLARKTGQVTKFGGELDYAVDMTLTGLCCIKALGPYGYALLPLITWAQAEKHAKGDRPQYGSARAALSVAKMLR